MRIFEVWCPNGLIVEEYLTYYFKWTVYYTFGSWPDLVSRIVKSDVAFSYVCKLIQISLAHSEETIL